MTKRTSLSKVIGCLNDIDFVVLKLRHNLFKGILTTIEFKQETDSKTLNQLGYFFGVVLEKIRQHEYENGNALTKEQVKEWIKDNFFYDEVVVGGIVSHIPKSIATASKEDLQCLIDKVINWCNSVGIDVPPPPEKELKWQEH